MLIVDTGPLLAAADTADPHHRACVNLLTAATGPLLTTPLVVAEAAYLIGCRIGPKAESRFFRSIADGDLVIETLTDADVVRMADLVEMYADLPLGGTDASVVAVAERHDQAMVATLDRRHFSVVRPRHVAGFELVPDLG